MVCQSFFSFVIVIVKLYKLLLTSGYIAQNLDYCQLFWIQLVPCAIRVLSFLLVNLLVIASNLSCIYFSLLELSVHFVCLYPYFFHSLFLQQEVILSSMFHLIAFWLTHDPNLIILQAYHPFLSEHAPLFIMLSSIMLLSSIIRHVFKDVY